MVCSILSSDQRETHKYTAFLEKRWFFPFPKSTLSKDQRVRLFFGNTDAEQQSFFLFQIDRCRVETVAVFFAQHEDSVVGFYDERAFLFYRRKKEISFEFTAAVVFKHDAQINEFCFADIFYCKKLMLF